MPEVIEFDVTPRPDGSQPTLAIIQARRTIDPKPRNSEALRSIEEGYMHLIADFRGARATHTGQGTTTGNGKHWDFELDHPSGTRGLGEHVLYTDPNTHEAPERASFRPRRATGWDPDGDFRTMLASPAIAKHVRRVSAWHSDPAVTLDESHLVIETHSVVPALELIDAWSDHYGHPLEPKPSTLTDDEVGDVTYIWVVSTRTLNILLFAFHKWIPLVVIEIEPELM